MENQLYSSGGSELFDDISYTEEFEELECIGRGNFGAAFLVKAKKPPLTGKLFIAK
jgi:hypothetical protein